MASRKQGKQTVVGLAEQLIAGTNKHLSSMASITLVGSSFTPAQVIEKLQSIVNLRNDVDTAKASAKAKLTAEKTGMPSLRTLMGALVAFVKAAYLNSPDVLADFGLHPKARTPLTVEAKAAAAAKRKATRAARHVMGSKQRKGVTGDVTGVTVTPIVAPKPSATQPTGPTAPATSGSTTAAPTPPRTT